MMSLEKVVDAMEEFYRTVNLYSDGCDRDGDFYYVCGKSQKCEQVAHSMALAYVASKHIAKKAIYEINHRV